MDSYESCAPGDNAVASLEAHRVANALSGECWVDGNKQDLYANYKANDRPIDHRDQDLLGRRSFSEAIARQIRGTNADNGLTIAVMGEWGSGKTSVLNMVADSLSDTGNHLTLLRFNPWLFSGASDLLWRFFGELSAQLNAENDERLKIIAKALTGLGQAVAPLIPIPGTPAFAQVAASFTEQWTKPWSLVEERDRLRRALERLDAKVVVIVDDIDRLEQGETRELMRLVRLTSDMPNVVFLLAFDRRRVARALGSCEADGQLYLDKIVQVSHELPDVRESILARAVLTWLEDLIRCRDVGTVHQDHWNSVFHEVIRPLLTNLRDVKRYLNSLPVTLDTLGDEVALTDVLGLEALRVLRPASFDALRSCSKCLVHPESEEEALVLPEQRNEECREKLEMILKESGRDRVILEAILKNLFPVTEGFLGNSNYGEAWIRIWRKDRRVACEQVFRVYLHAGLDDAELSASDTNDLVEALDDKVRFAQLLDNLEDSEFETALDRIQDFHDNFSREAISVAVPAIVNRMWRLSRHAPSIVSLRPRWKASQVVDQMLSKIEDSDDLFHVVDDVITNVESISGRLVIAEIVGHRAGVGSRLVSEEHACQLEDRVAEQLRITESIQLGVEWDLAKICMIIPTWFDDDVRNELHSRLKRHLKIDEFVFGLLRTGVDFALYNGHSEKRLFWLELSDVFGSELGEAVKRLPQSPMWKSVTQDDRDTARLAIKYASGSQPETMRLST